MCMISKSLVSPQDSLQLHYSPSGPLRTAVFTAWFPLCMFVFQLSFLDSLILPESFNIMYNRQLNPQILSNFIFGIISLELLH